MTVIRLQNSLERKYRFLILAVYLALHVHYFILQMTIVIRLQKWQRMQRIL